MAIYSEVFKRRAVSLLKELRDTEIIKMDGDENFRNIDNIRDLCGYLDISSQTLYAWEKKFSSLKTDKKDTSDEKVQVIMDDKIEMVDIIPLRVICVNEGGCSAYQSTSDNNENCNMLGNCNDFREVNALHKESISYGIKIKPLTYNERIARARKYGVDIHEHDYESELVEIKELKKEIEKLRNEIKALKQPILSDKETLVKNDFFAPEQDENLAKSTGEISQIQKDAIKKFATNQRSMSTLAQALQISNYSNMKVAQMRLAIGNELIKLSGLVDMNKAKRKLKKNGDNL